LKNTKQLLIKINPESKPSVNSPIGNIMLTFTAIHSFHCYDAQLYISMKHGDVPKLPSLEACVSDIRK
jgi:hypothetical protein